MHHSLKIKIQDLDHIESIVEQDITDVEAEKIVGGSVTAVAAVAAVGAVTAVTASVCAPDDYYCLMCVPPMPDPVNPTWTGDHLKISASKLLSTLWLMY